MNQEWLHCLMDMPLEEYENFKEHSKVVVSSFSKMENQKDYSWLGVIERYLPFLKRMMEDPYALWLKEDLKKNYECRFLYTLFRRLDDFLNRQYQRILEEKENQNQSHLDLESNTTFDEEEIHYEIRLTVKQKKQAKEKISIEERILQTLLFLEPLKHGFFMERMEGASLVRSPIRKDILLQSHDHYRKLIELSEFLDSYAELEKNLQEKNKRGDSQFLIPYFMNYALLKSSSSQDNSFEFLKKYLEGFIKQFVEESLIDEKTFKKMIQKLFEEEYAKKKNREKNIAEIFIDSFDDYQKEMKDAIRSLKG